MTHLEVIIQTLDLPRKRCNMSNMTMVQHMTLSHEAYATFSTLQLLPENPNGAVLELIAHITTLEHNIYFICVRPLY